MRVVAAGFFLDDGTITESTGNFAVSYGAGLTRYTVDIPSVSYFYSSFVTVATSIDGTVVSDSVSGDLLLTVKNDAGTKIQSSVGFVVYEIL